MNSIQWLGWDSEIFNTKVAKILTPQLTAAELESLLLQLKAQEANLIYWAAADNSAHLSAVMDRYNGFLADRKMTYLCHLKPLPLFESTDLPYQIEEYPSSIPSQELIDLAYLSGSYSRFQTDPGITEQQFKTVYRLWITNSVNKQLAEKVLVVKIQNQLAGMITLGVKEGRGDIGLLAVNEAYRGLKIGTALVKAALEYFRQRFEYVQVVTQQANLPACKLYESCGFWVEKIENFYHFWLARNRA